VRRRAATSIIIGTAATRTTAPPQHATAASQCTLSAVLSLSRLACQPDARSALSVLRCQQTADRGALACEAARPHVTCPIGHSLAPVLADLLNPPTVALCRSRSCAFDSSHIPLGSRKPLAGCRLLYFSPLCSLGPKILTGVTFAAVGENKPCPEPCRLPTCSSAVPKDRAIGCDVICWLRDAGRLADCPDRAGA
jgi:hypothetical protein